ncbi:phenylethanolamine N-methyltransferase [Latimeria chalumnae]|uniref:Phenylethanolamine N-methyltransferase n=1 Tax=Latimeria chalumnae TaxID=7897 RepID=H3B7B5_LATCH|nr:PREDICTED: phenylethanolamine N-methyltransferase [Latimeria chalumnae]|eukprot:XP_005994093.1 PREDICTED: phenylethanolamine N-methyltransferase [Latimeria chalumnae]
MSSLAAVSENYQKFNPKAYLQNNYMPPRANFSSEDFAVPWKLRCLAEAFGTGKIQGHTLMDIGSGPTIYQLLSACAHFDEIIMTDYLEVNREEIRKWLRADSDIFDWSPFIKHVCSIEGKGEHWTEKEKRLREKVKRVIPIDIHQQNPLHPSILEPVDGLISSFCLEACSPDKESFEKALKNITGLLKPGGYFLMIGALDESFYLAGEAKLTVVPLNEIYVQECFTKFSYKVCDFKTYIMPPSLKIGVDDVRGIFFVQAQKI